MRVFVKATLGIAAASGLTAALPYTRGDRTPPAPPATTRASTGTHLNVALSDQASARQAFMTLVVRPYNKQWLSDGADVWTEPPIYDVIATLLPHSKWEVLELSDANFVRGKRDKLFAALPSTTDRSRESTREPVMGVPAGYLETALVYTPQKGRGAAHGWAPLLDVAHYPDARALKDDPEGTLEAVLLSDGVAPSHLYPLDVERAFRALTRVRASVTLWWTNETDVARETRSGTIAMAVVPSTFLYQPEWAGTHLSVADSGTLGELRWWVVPRNVPLTAEMQRFLAYVSSQAEPIGTGVYYGLLSPRQAVPSGPMTASTNRVLANGHVLINEGWWAAHRDSMAIRWRTWRAHSPPP